MTERDAWLALGFAPDLGRAAARAAVAAAGSAAAAAARDDARYARALELAHAEEKRAELAGFRLVTLADPDYPELLARSSDPPPVLWVHGEAARLAAPAVAVVGARHASVAGQAAARSLGRGLAEAGVLVVSGLARGIDAAAHEGALDAPGRTAAVLGSSLDRVYPWSHRGLARRVAQSAAVLSEYPLGTDPRPYHFPERNRIIAGLVQAVIVVEAKERSGALITARLATEEGRDVLAIPGSPWDELHAGTNRLIQEGAALVQRLDDVLAELGLTRVAAAAPQPDAELSDEEKRVLQSLSPSEPRAASDVAATTGLAAAEVLAALTTLELTRLVASGPAGGYLALRRAATWPIS